MARVVPTDETDHPLEYAAQNMAVAETHVGSWKTSSGQAPDRRGLSGKASGTPADPRPPRTGRGEDIYSAQQACRGNLVLQMRLIEN